MVEKFGLLMIISGFIALTVGMTLIPSIGDSVEGTRVTADISEEQITLASGTATSANDDVTALTNFKNATIEYTDFVTNMNGSINFTEATGVLVCGANISDGPYNISYTYQPSAYVKDATSRTLMPLLTILFAIAVMAAGAAMVFGGFKMF